jgi:uncharacterized HAD superfamily protein/adenine/guanine phosphoribosyltransferase-like PRPP-binding protein
MNEMNYRSVSDLNAAIVHSMHRLPHDLDLIVGVPRSGLLAANLLALMGNVHLSDLDSYLVGRVYTPGRTKAHSLPAKGQGQRKVLVLDDSISTGASLREVRQRIAAAGLGDKVIFAAVYGTDRTHEECDLVFEVVPQPRIFQWNFMHHVALERACVDIDGVLCHDPAEEDNDDGVAYTEFLLTARPLFAMTRPIGALVTSRLEKYRPQTEAWLEQTGIRYHELVMLDLPSKAERQRLGAHGTFKADYYRRSPFDLFIESENAQAMTIARLSGKPVLCLETHSLVEPTAAAVLASVSRTGTAHGGSKAVKRMVRALLGSRRYDALKAWKPTR